MYYVEHLIQNKNCDDFKAGFLNSLLYEFVSGCETTSDVDKFVDQYNHVITDLLDKLAPVTEFTVREWVHHPWFKEESRSNRNAVQRLKHRFEWQKASSSRDTWRNACHASRKQSHRKSVAYTNSSLRVHGCRLQQLRGQENIRQENILYLQTIRCSQILRHPECLTSTQSAWKTFSP